MAMQGAFSKLVYDLGVEVLHNIILFPATEMLGPCAYPPPVSCELSPDVLRWGAMMMTTLDRFHSLYW